MKRLSPIALNILLLCSLALPAVGKGSYAIDADDEALLENIQRTGFDYFWNECGPNGLIQDRMTDKRLSLIMAVGFQLPVYCIGAEREWVSREDAAQRVLTVLRTFETLPKFHGIFAHYYDIPSGKIVPLMHVKDDGADVSETGFMMAGVLIAQSYFDQDSPVERDIRALAARLYEEVQWDWMLQDAEGRIHRTLSWHWSPNHGFAIGQRVKSNMELSSMITYLLAIGSPTHPIPPACWDDGWTRNYRWLSFEGDEFVACPPLFGHQYAQSWVDFRNRKDRHTDYFRNSIYAISANRSYCLTNLYPGLDLWGLTFCDGPNGYGIYGYPPRAGNVDEDATIAPTGPGGSVVFLPEESISALRFMYTNYADRLWGKYGFYDSFSLKKNWFDKDYISIDQGTMVVMIENLRSGLIWDLFMKNASVLVALEKTGFVGVIDDFESPGAAQPYAEWDCVTGEDADLQYDNRNVRLGRASLHVTANKARCKITARPALTRWSDFKALTLWLRGDETLEVSLTGEGGGPLPLAFECELMGSDGWRHLSFSIPEALGEDEVVTGDTELLVEIENKDGTPVDCWIDEVWAVPTVDVIPPARVKNIAALPAHSPGAILLSWSSSGDNGYDGTCYRYIVKRSEKPILEETDFDEAQPVSSDFEQRIPGTQTTYYVSGLAPGREYFFAIKAEDHQLNRSSLSPCASARAGAAGIPPVIDDFEDGVLSAPPTTWTWDKGVYELEVVTNGPAQRKASLRINYSKAGEAEKWSFIRGVVNHKNFSRPRYLAMDVSGDAEILLKVVNNEDRQEDVGRLSSVAGIDQWTRLRFDLSAVANIDMERVDEILLFVEPGVTDVKGTIWIDSVTMENPGLMERLLSVFSGD